MTLHQVCSWHGADVQRCPLLVCAVQRRRFPVGANPIRQPLQPEAIGAVMEVTKWLKPSISVSRIGDSASVQAATRVNAKQSACCVVCPAKAGMFSRRQTCRGRSQSPVVWIAEVMETETLKPIDKVSLGEATSHRAVTKVNALWPRK